MVPILRGHSYRRIQKDNVAKMQFKCATWHCLNRLNATFQRCVTPLLLLQLHRLFRA